MLVALLAAALVTTPASAAPSDVEVRAARQLFADAERDEDGGRWAEALTKLRRVAQVKLTAGIHYHVALCEEHQGQLAAALDEYTAAEGQARAENAQDVLRLVGKRIADLGPRVPRLTLRLVPDVADAAVTVDGAAISRAVLGTALPVDPGEHRVEATAPGRAPFAQTVTLRERDATTLDLKLAEPPSPPPPPIPSAPRAPEAAPEPPRPLPDAPSAPPGPSHTGPILATAGALVLAGGGLAAFVVAGNTHGQAVSQCARIVDSSPDACDSQKNGVRAWDYTAAGAWLAAAGVGALAVVLWAGGSTSSTPTASTRLFVGPGSVTVGGRF